LIKQKKRQKFAVFFKSDWRRVTLPRSWQAFIPVSRSSCVCTLVTLPTCSIWSAFASLNLDERAVTLRRLAKFSECGTMCGHLILHRADCNSTQSLYLLGCLSSVAEPPLVGLTFGLRSGLAPLLRSRSSRRTRLAPCCDTISGDTLTPRYADLFTRAIHFSQSQSLRGEELRLACVLRYQCDIK
jgi:hypothetical protein